MSDELKEIEVELAKIRLKRERMLLQDELKKREKSAKAIDLTSKTIQYSTTATTTLFKYLFGAFLGMAFVATLSLLFIAKQNDQSQSLIYSFGYWMGSGGYLILVIGAIGGIAYMIPEKQTVGLEKFINFVFGFLFIGFLLNLGMATGASYIFNSKIGDTAPYSDESWFWVYIVVSMISGLVWVKTQSLREKK